MRMSPRPSVLRAVFRLARVFSPLYLAIAGHEAVGKPIGGREPAALQGE
jgi:hypothetical protein